MAEIQQQAPIIIKKIKKGGHGHHGGAWKVAYADFVTAMMAFFLLMWLLNATTKVQKEGIADYFTPTVGLKDSLGIGFKGGSAKSEEGTEKSDMAKPAIMVGMPEQGTVATQEEKKSPTDAKEENMLFDKAAADIKKAFEEDPNLKELSENIILEQTPEGLKIEMLDLDKHPMFEPGTSELSVYGRRMLSKMVEVVKATPNYVSITGHTDTSAFAPSTNYTSWELSADRANASRRFMLSTNMEAERVSRVVGVADREPLTGEDPKSSRNRRISIILLRGAHMNDAAINRPAPRELLTVPKVNREPGVESKPEEKKSPPPAKVPVGGKPEAAVTPAAAIPPAAGEGTRHAPPISAMPSRSMDQEE